MKPNSILFVGCGDLGIRTALALKESEFSVAGVSRDPSRLPASFTRYAADYSESGSLDFIASAAPDYVIATFKPLQFSAEGYRRGFPLAMRNLLTGLGSHRPRAIFMVSSTRVFAECDGGWVDEDSALAQEGYAAKAIIEAEQMLRDSVHYSCIIRFGGIYGEPKGRLLSRIAGGELCSPEPVRYSNRIHRDDCAGFLAHLLNMQTRDLAPVYVGVDSLPAPQSEVEQWLAAQMGVSCRPQATVASPAKFRGHKRCSNRLMRQSGYSLSYNSYREGYGAVLADATEAEQAIPPE